MSLLLWEAPGPGRSTCGVSTDRARAERAVGDCLISGQATTAFVQEAELVTGSSALARDLLHAMRSDFVGGGLTGSGSRRSERRSSLRSSRWVWRKLRS